MNFDRHTTDNFPATMFHCVFFFFFLFSVLFCCLFQIRPFLITHFLPPIICFTTRFDNQKDTEIAIALEMCISSRINDLFDAALLLAACCVYFQVFYWIIALWTLFTFGFWLIVVLCVVWLYVCLQCVLCFVHVNMYIFGGEFHSCHFILFHNKSLSPHKSVFIVHTKYLLFRWCIWIWLCPSYIHCMY